MLLRPRKIKWKNSQKKRSHKFTKSKYITNSKLVYGQIGLKNLNCNYLFYNKYLFKLKIFLKKAIRRSAITNRHLWINIFPHLPITKKVIGSRMGKGKGKLSVWAAKIPFGITFIEFRNVRVGRGYYFFLQVIYRLSGLFRIIFKYNKKFIPLVSYKKRKQLYNYFL